MVGAGEGEAVVAVVGAGACTGACFGGEEALGLGAETGEVEALTTLIDTF